MKRVFQSTSTWIVVFLFIIIGVLYFFGFRITYAPELENSWNAISACAGWANVFASAIAIFVAIGIPGRIAEQQNRIALFDKRYSAFNTFAFLTSAVKQIVDDNVKPADKTIYFDNMINTYKSISIIRELTADCKKSSDIYVRLIFEAGKIQYLFKLKKMNIVIEFILAAEEYISNVYKGEIVCDAELRAKYSRLIGERLQEKLEAQVDL